MLLKDTKTHQMRRVSIDAPPSTCCDSSIGPPTRRAGDQGPSGPRGRPGLGYRLLLRAGDRLSERAVHRLDRVFAHDEATGEIGAAWGVKERVRMLLASTDLDAADTARGQLGITLLAADMTETWRLWRPSTTGGTRSRPSSTRPTPNWLDVFRYRNMMAAMARAATTSDAFNAIAEPQRRDILALLRAGERPVTDLAQELGMSQPRASKHLRVLREVGLVRVRGAGKQRLYGLDARGLRPVHEWVGGFERFWNESFDRLDTYVQDLKQTRQEE